MKVLKIASGILSIAMSLLVVLQSVFTDLLISITHNGQSPGIAGIVVAAMLLAGGIVSIASGDGSMEADAALMSLYGVGALVGFVLTGTVLWALWCVLCAALSLADCILLYRMDEDEDRDGDGNHAETADEGTDTGADEEPEAPVGEQVEVLSLWELVQVKDPGKRNLVIDVLPEQDAKSYLKQVISDFIERQNVPPAHPDPSAKPSPGSRIRRIPLPVALAAGGLLIVGAILFWALWGRGGDRPESPDPGETVSTQEPAPTPEPTP